MEAIDRELVEGAGRGDRECFNRLVERWQGRLRAFARRYLQDDEAAKDVVQQTFVKVYQKLGQLEDPARFNSWIHAIALNECRMQQRWRRARPEVPVEIAGDGWWATPAASPDLPDHRWEAKERIARCEAAFRRLPPEQQEVILLKELQGLKFREIADALDLPESTVKTRLYAGLKALRRLMGEGQNEM